jgi:hypothetical protein
MIRYALTQNGMNPDADEFIAVVTNSQKINIHDIIDFMVAEGTGLTRPQALAYFEKLEQTIKYFIKEGATINTSLFKTRTTISGVFQNERDVFNPSRHQVHVRMSAGSHLNQLESRLSVRKVSRPAHIPQPMIFLDMPTQSENERIIPGNIAYITGYNLKLNPEDVQQGVFFLPIDRPKEEIRVEVYYKVKPSELMFQVPSLSFGNYTVKVKAIMKNHKSVRKGELPFVLKSVNLEI